MTKKYRFNRKSGRIYLDPTGKTEDLVDMGSSITILPTSISEPYFKKLFPHLAAQWWLDIEFLDHLGEESFAYIGSGTTDALEPWLNFTTEFKSPPYPLLIISLVEVVGAENCWHDYDLKYLVYPRA